MKTGGSSSSRMAVLWACMLAMALAAMDSTIVCDRYPHHCARSRGVFSFSLGFFHLSAHPSRYGAYLWQTRRPLRTKTGVNDRHRNIHCRFRIFRTCLEYAGAHCLSRISRYWRRSHYSDNLHHRRGFICAGRTRENARIPIQRLGTLGRNRPGHRRLFCPVCLLALGFLY